MDLHEMLGLGPDEFMRFCEQAALVAAMAFTAVLGMLMAYAKGRCDERRHTYRIMGFPIEYITAMMRDFDADNTNKNKEAGQ